MTGKILAVSLNPAVDISCSAERVKPTIKVRTRDQVQDPGGCGINVARVIATLGGKPALVYMAGGATGALLTEILAGWPIKPHAVTTSGATRISYTVRDLSDGLEYRFVPEGPETSASEIQQVLNIIEKLDFDYMVLTGSLPKNTPDDSYVRIADIAVQKGAKVILDTSGSALAKTLESTEVFLVKPSLSELEELVGKSLDAVEAGKEALKIIRRGSAQNVAVSMDQDGALLVTPTGVLSAPAIEVDVCSAVGAGDSFVGAMTFALANNIAMEEAFQLAIAAGAAAVMTPGTQLCRRQDVVRLYKQESIARDRHRANRLLDILER